MSENIEKVDVLTDPRKLVARELKIAGFDINEIEAPRRVYLLADDFYDVMLSRKCGRYKYPLGGELYVFDCDASVGFVKSMTCSPAIATQAEDLIAGGVRELVHLGFAGGLDRDIGIGDIVLTDGAYNDTAVAALYGFDRDFIPSTGALTDELQALLEGCKTGFKRGKHWTTDAGYMETYTQALDRRSRGALCVEMEGVGLFTVANYRQCAASAIYVVSDVLSKEGWSLGWGATALEKSVNAIIDAVISALPGA